MASNNPSNASTQGVQYYNGSAFSGIDASTATYVLTSNGTGLAPSFQSIPPQSRTIMSVNLVNALTNVTGDGTVYHVAYDTVVYDPQSTWNGSTHVFTAPSTGIYYFTINWRLDNLSSGTWGGVYLQTTSTEYELFYGNPYAVSEPNQTSFGTPVAQLALMSAGDTAYVSTVVSNGPKTVGMNGDLDNIQRNSFSVFSI